ncbi:right-handed parallel beta-helix repeat-containing protein [bacterium]|nr:right-handed parallel beta-helix repeat-containing protein [bacterium]
MNKCKFNLCAAGLCCLLAFASPAVQAETASLPSFGSAPQLLAAAQVKQVEVSNVIELLSAIDNNTEIILKPGTYNFSQYFNSEAKKGLDWNAEHPHIMWESGELTVVNVSGLTLRAKDGDNSKTRLVTEDAYSNVIQFKHCVNVTMVGMTMGHEVEPGVCSGSVVAFDNCENVCLKAMDLYGCGAYGISGYGIKGLTAISCRIHDCSYGMLEINSSSGLRFSKCEFTRCKQYTLLSLSSGDALFKECRFIGNKGDFFNKDGSASITFEKCEFGFDEQQFIDEHPQAVRIIK